MKITIEANYELFPEKSLHDLVKKWEVFKKETEEWEKECQKISESCKRFNDDLMKKILPEEEILNRKRNHEVNKIKNEIDSIGELFKNVLKERDESEARSYKEKKGFFSFLNRNKDRAIYKYDSIDTLALYERLISLLRQLLDYNGGFRCLIEDYGSIQGMYGTVIRQHIIEMSRFLVNRQEKLSEALPKVACRDTRAGKTGPRHLTSAKKPCYVFPKYEYKKSPLREQLKKIVLPKHPDSEVELKKGSMKEIIDFLDVNFNINIVKDVLERKIQKRTKYESVQALAAAHQNETRSLAEKIKRDMQNQMKILNYCPYCGKSFGEIDPSNSSQLTLFERVEGKEIQYINAHADHIYPVSKGGLSTRKNMVYICSECNMKKSDKTLREFIKENNLDRDKIEKNLELLKKSF